MGKLLFRNRYFALVWVALTLFSAAAFVGDGGGKEQIDAAAERIQAQQQALEAPSAGHTFAAEEEPDEEEPAEDPDLTADPTAGDPQILTGPDGARYRVLTPDEAARVNGAEEPAE